jgi:predicted O-methyltransferase YrrM
MFNQMSDTKDHITKTLAFLKENKQFNFIYVDGSHLCLDTYLDFVLSWKLLRVDGIMAIDDYLFKTNEVCSELERPYEAVEHFMKKYEGDFEIINKGYRVFLKKIR